MSEAKERLKAAAYSSARLGTDKVIPLADAVREIETLEAERDGWRDSAKRMADKCDDLTQELQAAEEEIEASCKTACKHCRESTPSRYNAGTWEHDLAGERLWFCDASNIRERRYQRSQLAEAQTQSV